MDKTLLYLKRSKHNLYDKIKTTFLFHSNKIEGSTFSVDQLDLLISEHKVSGTHDMEDVIETRNSVELFDYIVDTAEEKLTLFNLREYHAILKKDTIDERYNFAGQFKKIPNELKNIDLKLAQPHEVEELLTLLLDEYKDVKMDLERVADFHKKFELIHPFNDGNGRIGRFIMMKQCIQFDIDFILIDEKNERQYRDALFESQLENDNSYLLKVFEEGQENFKKQAGLYYEIKNNYQEEVQEMDEVEEEMEL